jgi:septum formation protein
VINRPLLVLASNSPRRKQLLALSGWKFKVEPAEVDEGLLANETAGDYVLRLAITKVKSCAGNLDDGQIAIAADTAVVDEKSILGKPGNDLEADRMLNRLRGHTHQVLTAIAVLKAGEAAPVTALCITNVPMRNYSDDEIAAYIATSDPLDKAGAYAIQHAGFNPVESFSGCYSSVMGLPLCHLVHIMQGLSIQPVEDVPENCQATHAYQCSIYPAALNGKPVG